MAAVAAFAAGLLVVAVDQQVMDALRKTKAPGVPK
jgi:hypothetical protein